METVDRAYMEQALRLAFAGMGTTSPNPSVGAVLVRDGVVISTGSTCGRGGDHAEVCALGNACAPVDGGDLYVTLEPCCHHGKTPPCTDALIASGVRRVFIPILDPNPRVAGRGVECLRSAGVDVIMIDEMASAANDLIRPFKKYILHNRPFVVHKAAISLDGRIATHSGDSRWISGDASRFLVHRLRSLADAIIVGKGTVEKDDPELNVRLGSFSDEAREPFARESWRIDGYQNHFLRLLLESVAFNTAAAPLRVVIGIPDMLRPDLKIFGDDRVLLIGTEKQRNLLEGRQDHLFVRELEDSGRLALVDGDSPAEIADNVLRLLHGRGIMMALLESGGILAASFFDANAIDQYIYFIAPRVIGGGVPVLNGRGGDTIAGSLRLRDISTVVIGEDVLYGGYGGIS
ncbi:MAG TPA: bifunctional diaminohydroxyphosphoribosylaminopyrimidine deaminase/5-amino-6-(5-phosphoribosylamino)uracil reductase RibD [Spirochaetota bacterium]|nr:bifunctional diaminohydroxyphosphoribosylaminopyrimidine deaminase/5-amino-6-(5-phosphoribosylamino)uracil reductase RibD [Spirochaetota bacterium]